jgi:hypothetical protein
MLEVAIKNVYMNRLKNILFNGLTLAIPIVAIGYLLLKLTNAFERLFGPLVIQFGIERLLGKITLTFLAMLSILLLIIILGLLMKLTLIASFGKVLEDMILKFLPWLNQIKVMAADSLDLENVSTQWKPVLLYTENAYFLAFLVDESQNLASFFVVKGSKTDEGELMTTEKGLIKYYPIEGSELRLISKQYGKGMIALITKLQGRA